MAAAQSLDEGPVMELYDKFLAYKAYTRTSLIERINELKPHLDHAIDAVEAERGREVEQKAGQRTYVPEQPPRFAGDGPP